MSTGLIVVIVVVAIIIIALLMLLPRMRGAARHKQAERELRSRREQVAGEHRQAATQRETRAEEAERKARMAQQAAQRERAEANMEHERASMHERGMADDQLIDEHERDRFAGVAGPDQSADADRDGHTEDDRARAATDRDQTTGTPPTGAAATDRDRTTGTDRDTTAESQGIRSGTTGDTGEPAAAESQGIRSGTTGDTAEPAATSPDYQHGREDERRFERSRLTEDVRESDRSRTS